VKTSQDADFRVRLETTGKFVFEMFSLVLMTSQVRTGDVTLPGKISNPRYCTLCLHWLSSAADRRVMSNIASKFLQCLSRSLKRSPPNLALVRSVHQVNRY